jgi:hypothetical protein
MDMLSFTKVMLISILLALLGDPETAIANDLKRLKVVGIAPITSDISKNTFRNRAIEDAFNQVLIQNTQSLKSISVVENGRLVLDQVRSISGAKILNFSVISEKIQNKIFSIEIEFLFTDDLQNLSSKKCRGSNVSDLYIALNVSHKLTSAPHWLQINESELKKKISAIKFDGAIINTLEREVNVINKFYKLNNSSEVPKSVYELETDIDFIANSKQGLLGKNRELQVIVVTSLIRNKENISKNSSSQSFDIEKFFGNISMSGGSRNWDRTKNDIFDFITANVINQISKLKCLDINPIAKVSGDLITMNFGELDGIRPTDVLSTYGSDGTELYFIVNDLKQHEATLELISNVENVKSISGKTLQLIGELSNEN